jgi:hypothetical protein
LILIAVLYIHCIGGKELSINHASHVTVLSLSKLFLTRSEFGKPEMIDQYDVIARTVCRVLTKTILRII